MIAADLFCGLGGWTEGLLAEGWHVRGYDIEVHEYGDEKYPGEFVLRDILQMHGSEIADVELIVSSSPCTDYSYMAMPWTRAKAKAAAIRAGGPEALIRLNMLFDAQFRIQREASEAAGRYIPMVIENVRGARSWVDQQSVGHYGSYYLWGDVPPSIPKPVKATKVPGFRFDGSGGSFQTASVQEGHLKAPPGTRWFNDGPRTPESLASSSSNSKTRKAASARIAKIPIALSRYIARYYAEQVLLS